MTNSPPYFTFLDQNWFRSPKFQVQFSDSTFPLLPKLLVTIDSQFNYTKKAHFEILSEEITELVFRLKNIYSYLLKTQEKSQLIGAKVVDI